MRSKRTRDRLFRKKLEDANGRFYLQLLQLKMMPEMYEEEEALAESFKMQYKNGCRSRSSISRRSGFSGRTRSF